MAKKKSLRETVEEQHQDWVSTVQSLSVEELDKMILRYAKYREEIKEAREKDEELNRAKEIVKELGAPYRENLKINEQKTKYLIMLLGEKGGNTSGSV
jgi:trehalose/maltose hydrolase-like predicted phosphorylase